MNYLLKMYLDNFDFIKLCLIYFSLFALFIFIFHKTAWSKMYSPVSNGVHQVFFSLVPFVCEFILVTSRLSYFHVFTKSYYPKGPNKTFQIVTKLLATRSALCSKKNVVTYHIQRIFEKIKNPLIQQSQRFSTHIQVFKDKFKVLTCLKEYQSATQLFATPESRITESNPTVKETTSQQVSLQTHNFFNAKHFSELLNTKSKSTQLCDTVQSFVNSPTAPYHEMTGVPPLMNLYEVEKNCRVWHKDTPFFNKRPDYSTVCKQFDISISIQCFLQQTNHLKDAKLMLTKAQNLCDTLYRSRTSFSFHELMKRLIYGLLAQDNYYHCSCAFLCVLKLSDMEQEQHILYVELFTKVLKSFFSSSHKTGHLTVITQDTIQLFLNLITEKLLNEQNTLLSLYSNEIFICFTHLYQKRLEDNFKEDMFQNPLIFSYSLICMSHCGINLHTSPFQDLIMTYIRQTKQFQLPCKSNRNPNDFITKTLYDLLKKTRRSEKVSKDSRYICHVLNVVEEMTEKGCDMGSTQQWRSLSGDVSMSNMVCQKKQAEKMNQSLENFSFHFNRTPLKNTKDCQKELEGVIFQDSEEQKTPCLSEYLTNNITQNQKTQWKQTSSQFKNPNHSKDILKNSFNLSPGSTTSTDIPMSLTSFPGTVETQPLRQCESSVSLNGFLIKSCQVTDLNSAHHALKVFTENGINRWTLTEKQNLHPTFLSMFHQFISHREPQSISKLVQLIENFYSINAEIYEIAIKFFCHTTLLNPAGFYVFRLILWIDNHVDKTQCDEEKYLSFFQNVSTDNNSHDYPQKDEESNELTPNLECRLLLTPSSEPSTPYLSLFRSLVWYITMLIKNGNKREAFHFIFVRLEFLQNYPRLISWLFHFFLKMKPEKDILRCIFNVFMTYTPFPFEARQPQQLTAKNIAINASIFMTLCEACIRQKDIPMLLTLLDKFKNSWYQIIQPDAQTWGMFIKALGIHKRIDECRWIFIYLTQAQQLERCEVAYGCYLDALINNNKMAEAVQIFEKLKREGSVYLNTIMFSTIAKGYAQGKQLDNALKIHQEMKQLGISINTVTYNTLVDACARVGAIDKAADLLQDMIECNIEPDLITFSTVAKGYCVKGDVTQAIKLLDAMQQRGISPDGILYNSLLDGCVKASRLDLCQEIWKRMQKNQIAPSNFTLTILIKMFGRIGNLQQAFLLVHELPKRYGFQINAHVYTCLMSACIANKEYCKSVQVFECMKKDGVQADTKTYETALTGILRSGKYEYGLILVRDAFRLDSHHQQSFYSKNSFHEKSEYKKKLYTNQTSQHSSYLIPGLSMNPYSILMLWNQLKQNCQCQNEVYETLRDLQKKHGTTISKFLPNTSNSLRKNNQFR